ncbi:hypothetical protein [Schlesneria sp. T3-172]|uniref:hypothetical protein n=1 Tax=Schlesneria sphaerica TaxID=3373610 RepID=UPI0037C9E357
MKRKTKKSAEGEAFADHPESHGETLPSGAGPGVDASDGGPSFRSELLNSSVLLFSHRCLVGNLGGIHVLQGDFAGCHGGGKPLPWPIKQSLTFLGHVGQV